MAPRVQRAGSGPWGVAAGGRASSPGPRCRRSWSCCLSCWSRLKAAPAVAAVLVGKQAGEAFVLVTIEPGVHRIRIAAAEQAGVGHGIGGLSVSDLEQGGTAFTDVGLGVVVAMVDQ